LVRASASALGGGDDQGHPSRSPGRLAPRLRFTVQWQPEDLVGCAEHAARDEAPPRAQQRLAHVGLDAGVEHVVILGHAGGRARDLEALLPLVARVVGEPRADRVGCVAPGARAHGRADVRPLHQPLEPRGRLAPGRRRDIPAGRLVAELLEVGGERRRHLAGDRAESSDARLARSVAADGTPVSSRGAAGWGRTPGGAERRQRPLARAFGCMTPNSGR
jgi:hypothetical protein